MAGGSRRIVLLYAFVSYSICYSHSLECYKLEASICQGLGYSKTTSDSAEQMEKELVMLDIYEETAPECQTQVRSFLCFTFFPKCRRKYEYGQMPCDSTCEQIKESCGQYLSSITCDTLLSRREGNCMSYRRLSEFFKTVGAKYERKTVKPTKSAPSTKMPLTSVTTMSSPARKTSSLSWTLIPEPSAKTESLPTNISENILTSTLSPKPEDKAKHTSQPPHTSSNETCKVTDGTISSVSTSTTTTAVMVTSKTSDLPRTSAVSAVLNSTLKSTTTSVKTSSDAITTSTISAHSNSPVFENTTLSTTLPPSGLSTVTSTSAVSGSTSTSAVSGSTEIPVTWIKVVPSATQKLNVTTAMVTEATTKPWYHNVKSEDLVKRLNISQIANTTPTIIPDEKVENLTHIEALMSMVKRPWYQRELNYSFIQAINSTAITKKVIERLGLNGTESTYKADQVWRWLSSWTSSLAATTAQPDTTKKNVTDLGIVAPIFINDTESSGIDRNKTAEHLFRVLDMLKKIYL